MPLGAGARIGPYEIVDAVGSGGMGRVFRARDTRLGRDVALKFLHDTGGPDATARLMREARAASALNHPNICQIYDVGDSAHGPWIAMEFVPGDRLDARIPQGGLAVETSISLGVQIAGALSHAHTRGIVHRDLKTGNCVWSADGPVKVLDFGLAGPLPERVAEAATRSDVASVDALSGTPAYMAPEVFRGEPGDARSDLWALGIVLYELSTGTRPFAAASVYELASAVLDSDPAPLPARLPDGYRHVVMRLLRKEAAERYQSADAVRAALETLTMGGRGTAGERRGPAMPGARPAGPRRWLTAGLVGSLALALAAAGLWTWRSGDRPLALSALGLLSTFEGSHQAPSLSPDARTVAFVAADEGGVPQIWIKSLAEGEPRQITAGPAPARRPRWRPDGGGIVFARQSDGIWVVPPLGGTPRRIAERGTNPNVSRDGAYLTWETDEGIWIARADGTDARMVEGVPQRYYRVPRVPALSPDGSLIAFFHPEAGPNGDFWIIPAAGGEPTRLTSDVREGGAPLWTPDGERLIFSSARAGSRTLWQVRVEGGTPEPLTTGAGEDDMPDLSADGTRLVFTNTRNGWDIRLADPSGEERPLLQRRTDLLFPAFSPDGSRIAFFGRASAAVAIFTMARDGSDFRQLTSGAELNHQPRWSGDGESVFYYQIKPDIGLRRVPALGGPSAETFPWNWEIENSVQFAPDGDRVVYTRLNPLGREASGPEVTIVRTISTGAEVLLPEPHLHYPRFSRDGRFIAGSRHDGSLAICDAAGRGCRDVPGGTQLSPVAWGPGDTRLYFLRSASREGPQQLWSVRPDGTGEERVREIGPFRGIDRYFDVSPTGEIVWAPWQPGSSELWTATVR